MPSELDLQQLIVNIDKQLSEVTDRAAIIEQQAVADREVMLRFILVEIKPLSLAIAIDDLSEVGPLPLVTFLPNLPAWIQGIINIRSEIVSVIDFCTFINVAERGVCRGSRLAVLRHKKRKIGIRIDNIIGTVSKGMSERKPLDASGNGSVNTSLFTGGLVVEKEFYFILNVPKFLTAKRLLDYNGKG